MSVLSEVAYFCCLTFALIISNFFFILLNYIQTFMHLTGAIKQINKTNSPLSPFLNLSPDTSCEFCHRA